MTVPLRVLSTLAVAGAMRDLLPGCEAAAGTAVSIDFAPTQGLLARIRGGERADIAILTEDGLAALGEEGVLDPAGRSDLVRSHIGIAVRAGAPRPAMDTVEALRATLLAVPSLVYSRSGASGIAFAALIERLGIAGEVNAKARIIPAGFTAEPVARGEAALAVQQVSELLAVPGIELAGRLPEEVGTVAVFGAGPFTGAPPAAGRAIRFLASADAAPALAAAGLEPILRDPLAAKPPAA